MHLSLLRSFICTSSVAFVLAAAACSSDDEPAPSGTTNDGGAGASDAQTTASDASAASDADAAPGPTTVTVSNFAFSPKTVTIKVGEKVVWTFKGGSHSVTSGKSCTADGLFDSEVFPSPYTFEHTFDKTGTFDYFCNYMDHCTTKNQVGVVIVEP